VCTSVLFAYVRPTFRPKLKLGRQPHRVRPAFVFLVSPLHSLPAPTQSVAVRPLLPSAARFSTPYPPSFAPKAPRPVLLSSSDLRRSRTGPTCRLKVATGRFRTPPPLELCPSEAVDYRGCRNESSLCGTMGCSWELCCVEHLVRLAYLRALLAYAQYAYMAFQ
jgi:hypothetical protein